MKVPVLLSAVILLASCGGSQPSGTTSDGGIPTSLTITAPYSVGAGKEVTYECYATTMHFHGTAYIDTFTPHEGPGTHHIVLFVDHSPSFPDGMFPCPFFTGSSQTVIYASGIGSSPTIFPPGVGYPLHDGDQLILQLHEFNPTDSDITSMTTLDLGFAQGTDITPAAVVLAGPLAFSIPAGAAGYVVNGQCSGLPAGSHVFAVFPHMHQIGAKIQVTLDTPTGMQTLASVTPWDFTEQPVFNVTPPAEVAPGGKEYVQCTYDNTTGHTVSFGQSSTDEMCFGITYFYPASPSTPILCYN